LNKKRFVIVVGREWKIEVKAFPYESLLAGIITGIIAAVISSMSVYFFTDRINISHKNSVPVLSQDNGVTQTDSDQ